MSDIKTESLWLMKGDCLERMKEIESGSIDLILTDLPYGTAKGLEIGNWSKDTTKWDAVIDCEKIHEEANRMLRKNGKMVLFAQAPFTIELIIKSVPNLPFNYSMIWEKNHFANGLMAKKAPVKYFEDILVFSKKHESHDFEGFHPLRDYFKDVMSFTGLNKKQIISNIGQKADHVFRVSSTQFGLCTEKTYEELIEKLNIDKMEGFKEFSELKKINKTFNEKYPSTFNLWEGNKYKSNILKYKKDGGRFHPTQKPVLLLEDLVKTFSNEGDTVVDMTMGSGSTGCACVNAGREFIGIEMDDNYFDIAKNRILENKQ